MVDRGGIVSGAGIFEMFEFLKTLPHWNQQRYGRGPGPNATTIGGPGAGQARDERKAGAGAAVVFNRAVEAWRGPEERL